MPTKTACVAFRASCKAPASSHIAARSVGATDGLTADGDDVRGAGVDGAGRPEGGGDVMEVGLVADAQAETRRETMIVVATDESEARN